MRQREHVLVRAREHEHALACMHKLTSEREREKDFIRKQCITVSITRRRACRN